MKDEVESWISNVLLLLIPKLLLLLLLVSGETKQEVELWISNFDVDGTGCISLQEFTSGMAKWVRDIKKQVC